LIIGLLGSVLTGAGDFLLGFGEEIRGSTLASNVMSNAMNLSDAQLIWGGLLGFIGLFLEGLAFFAIYRLMADAAPKYAHIYRAGIFGYIWLAPVGCHMNVGVLNIAYKYLLTVDPSLAEQVGNKLLFGFSLPVWILLVFFWLPMLVIQFRAFSKGLTPYPTYAKWFNLFVGGIPALVISMLIGAGNPWGPAIGTMFLSFGNAFTFGGLLVTLPSEAQVEAFRNKLPEVHQK
ncbi:MAG: hypothetical protein IJK38_00470, partial [Oscillospiraceae bacterium]|nr:hypothetical protein [Oscillospiraceae bacterium]